jgi:hypothetical protein
MPETTTGGLRETLALFRALNPEQRVAAVAALLLIVSTFGPFSFVEAAEVLVALGVLALLRARALGKRFHLPLGDGTAIAAAGVWAGLLIVARLFDRPLGQNLLALACAAILALAGARERAKRPADDLPEQPAGAARRAAPAAPAPPRAPGPRTPAAKAGQAGAGEQLTLPDEEDTPPTDGANPEPDRDPPGDGGGAGDASPPDDPSRSRSAGGRGGREPPDGSPAP